MGDTVCFFLNISTSLGYLSKKFSNALCIVGNRMRTFSVN